MLNIVWNWMEMNMKDDILSIPSFPSEVKAVFQKLAPNNLIIRMKMLNVETGCNWITCQNF